MKKIEEKLYKTLSTEINRLKGMIIESLDNGDYFLFGRYTVSPVGQDFRVSRGSTEMDFLFRRKKSAISWCVADNANKQELAFRISDLDRRIFNLEQALIHRKHVIKSVKEHNTYMHLRIRNEYDQDMLTQLLSEYDNCVQYAKYIQTRGFANETSRNGPTPSLKISH